MFMQLLCRHKCRHRVIKCGMNHCKVCSVSVSDCTQRRQFKLESCVCLPNNWEGIHRTLVFVPRSVGSRRSAHRTALSPCSSDPFPGCCPPSFQEIDTLINAHHVQRAADLSRSLIALYKEGKRYYHTYYRLPLKVAVTAGFVGWLVCVLVAIPSKKFLGKIPAQDLDQLAKIMPAKFWPRSYSRYGKISASWQDLGLLPRSCSSWQESRIFPKNFLLGLGEVAPFL